MQCYDFFWQIYIFERFFLYNYYHHYHHFKRTCYSNHGVSSNDDMRPDILFSSTQNAKVLLLSVRKFMYLVLKNQTKIDIYVPLQVEYMDLGSPVTNNHYIRSIKGEITGLDHNKNRFRPDVATKLCPEIGLPGLYLTGQVCILK